MKNRIQLILVLLGVVVFASCDDEFTDDIVKDNLPEVPVVFPGATTHGFNPYYTVSISGTGDIGITMEIPATSDRSIKHIRKVVAGATGITPGNLLDATTAYASDVAVNAKTVTFSTTIAEFNSKVSSANRVPATIAPGAFVERAFLFAVVLDDDTEVIPVQVRIRFVQ